MRNRDGRPPQCDTNVSPAPDSKTFAVHKLRIDQRQVEIARRCLRADLSQQRLLVGPPIRTDHYQTARTLLVRYGATEGLRTLDTLQLAVALDLRQLGLIGVNVAADQRLCRVATLAGCSVVNPEKPGPLLA